jgi:hypothetical protein
VEGGGRVAVSRLEEAGDVSLGGPASRHRDDEAGGQQEEDGRLHGGGLQETAALTLGLVDTYRAVGLIV